MNRPGYPLTLLILGLALYLFWPRPDDISPHGFGRGAGNPAVTGHMDFSDSGTRQALESTAAVGDGPTGGNISNRSNPPSTLADSLAPDQVPTILSALGRFIGAGVTVVVAMIDGVAQTVGIGPSREQRLVGAFANAIANDVDLLTAIVSQAGYRLDRLHFRERGVGLGTGEAIPAVRLNLTFLGRPSAAQNARLRSNLESLDGAAGEMMTDVVATLLVATEMKGQLRSRGFRFLGLTMTIAVPPTVDLVYERAGLEATQPGTVPAPSVEAPVSGGRVSGGRVSGGRVSGGPVSGGPVSGGPVFDGPVFDERPTSGGPASDEGPVRDESPVSDGAGVRR